MVEPIEQAYESGCLSRDKLEAENKRLRDALEKIADNDTTDTDTYMMYDSVELSGIAKQALAKLEVISECN